MEAMAQMRAAEPGIALTLHGLDAALRGDCDGIENGMHEAMAVEYVLFRCWLRCVQGHEDRPRRIDALQPVHPIGHRNGRIVAMAVRPVNTACPATLAFGHDADILVQDGLVLLVAESTQQLALDRRRIAESAQRLVAVAGE